jgi:hypothetical protein
MPARDSIHHAIKDALKADGWEITDDPFVMAYGERLLFVDLAAEQEILVGALIGAQQAQTRIAVEIKVLRGQSPLSELEQAIGQYVLYRLLLRRLDPERQIFLAIPETAYYEIFSEPIGTLVLEDLPLNLLVVDITDRKVKAWIPKRPIAP